MSSKGQAQYVARMRAAVKPKPRPAPRARKAAPKSIARQFGNLSFSSRAPAMAPAAMSTPTKAIGPKTRQVGTGIRVRHREFLFNVVGSPNWTIQTRFATNPGLQSAFPWLSQVAANYEQYQVHALSYEYITRTGTNTPGSVQIIPDYDPMDPAPSSESAASSSQDMVEDSCWRNLVCKLNVANIHGMAKRLFVRNQSIPAGADLKTYDGAIINLATADSSGNPTFGKLWVEYDIEFFIPSVVSHSITPKGAFVHVTGVPSNSTILGSPSIHGGLLPFTVSGQTITVAKGLYFMSYFADCASGGTPTTALPTVTGGFLINTYDENGISSAVENGRTIINVMFQITSVTGTVVLDFTSTTTWSDDDLFLFSLPYGTQ